MFGNVISNSKSWKTKLLGDICVLKAGKNIKAKDIHEYDSDEMYPCYGGNGLRGYVKTYSHEGNINIIGRQGALCGNVKYVKGKFYATEHAVVVQPKIDINSYWLHFVLRELDLNRLATGAAQPGLTVRALSQVNIPIVEIEFQNQFADFVKQIDKLKQFK
ncbi:MAG: restriction endonuclease subunit S [Clostridium sp.]|nr:restriction endonuclease subunit S [Clostridium sp.]